MQSSYQSPNQKLYRDIAKFTKRSFLFAFFSATLLYIVVRIFFYEFPFSLGEGIELYVKILLVIWIFIVACKVSFSCIVWIENNFTRRTFNKLFHAPVLKKAFLIMLAAILGYIGKAQVTQDKAVSFTPSNSESAVDTDINFLGNLPY